jgi:hypothetical protein
MLNPSTGRESGSMQKITNLCFLLLLVVLMGCKKDKDLAELTGRWDVDHKEILFWEWSYEYIIGTYICVDEEEISITKGDEYFEFYLDGTWEFFKLTDGSHVSVKNGLWDVAEQSIDEYHVEKITSSNLILVDIYNQTGKSYQEISIHCQR